MKFELQRDEVNTGTGEKGTVCEPCPHHRHNECDTKVNYICKSRSHNPS